jgi:hypothetical protein
MFRVRDSIYFAETPFPAASGLWIAKAYAISKDIVVDVFARSMSYAGEKEEFLCHIVADGGRVGVGGEVIEEDLVVEIDDGVYPLYGAKNEKGELVQVRLDAFITMV